MAATFLQALKERYDAVRAGAGLPAVGEEAWAGVIPEGKANNFPNVVCEHLGEVPQYQRVPGDEGLPDGEVVMTEGQAEFRVYATGLAACEALAGSLMAAFTTRCLAVAGADVTLYRRSYLVGDAGWRGPKGEFVFVARVRYLAQSEKA